MTQQAWDKAEFTCSACGFHTTASSSPQLHTVVERHKRSCLGPQLAMFGEAEAGK